MDQGREDPARATAWWTERAKTSTSTLAVVPNAKWARYNAWTTSMLQRWALQQLDRPRFQHMLDLGCGVGHWTALFAPRVDEIHACDVAPEFVAATKAQLEQVGHPRFQVDCSDVRSYPIPKGVDFIYIGGVLMYMPDEDVIATLTRIREAAAPRALLMGRDFGPINLGRPSIQTTTGFSLHRTPKQQVALAEKAGLECIEIRPSPHIYGKVMAGWPGRVLWRIATAHWMRSSYSWVYRTP